MQRLKATLRRTLMTGRAQGMLEFALALPVLLLLVFGVIEFGRMLQAWLALENGARFAVRYAITGNYDPAFCEEAHAKVAADLGMSESTLHDQDNLDGSIDCRIPHDAGVHDWEDKTGRMQDYARLPSIREAGLAGATGIDWSQNASGNYNDYISNPYDSFHDDYRGTPSQPGYFMTTICSNRRDETTSFGLDSIAHYFGGVVGDANLFPVPCLQFNLNDGSYIQFADDAGGPGDRVRVTLTYRHTLITPFLSSWWPTLRLSSTREGLVEKFRTSRVTGLTGGIIDVPTITPSATSTATQTSTATNFICNGTGATFEQFKSIGSGNNISDLWNASKFPWTPDVVNTSFGPLNWPQTSPDQNSYGVRVRGYICAPQTANYTFYIASDDSSQFWFNRKADRYGTPDINLTSYTSYQNFSASSPFSVSLTAGQRYYFDFLMKEGSGGDHFSIGWKGQGIGDGTTVLPVAREFLTPYEREPQPTPATCANTGYALREVWLGIATPLARTPTPKLGVNGNYEGGLALFKTAVAQRAPNYNATPTVFEAPQNVADYYGTNLRAYLCPPYTGDYTFFIANDDPGELWMNVGGTLTLIANARSATGYRTWNKVTPTYTGEPGSRSQLIHLDAGVPVYMEAFHREYSGGDYISVAWDGPFIKGPAVITGQYLIPLEPRATATPFTAACSALVGRASNDDQVLAHANFLDTYLYNQDSVYSVFLTGLSGAWNENWHTVADEARPAIALTSVSWLPGATSAAPTTLATISPATNLGAPVTAFSSDPFAATAQIIPNNGGFLHLNLSRNLDIPNEYPPAGASSPRSILPTGTFNYYHGDDFGIAGQPFKVYYKVGMPGQTEPMLTCTLDLVGRSGPTLTYNTIRPPSPGPTDYRFNIQANATAAGGNPARSIAGVQFSVYRVVGSTYTLVHWVNDTSSPYCLFATSSGSSCTATAVGYTWNGCTNPSNPTSCVPQAIGAGNYLISMIATDNGRSMGGSVVWGTYSTRITVNTYNVAGPVATPVTPTSTAVPPTATNSPIPPTATNTPIPPTATDTLVPTGYTPPPPPTSTPTPPEGPVDTPTLSSCPPDRPGCRRTATPTP